MQGSLSEFADQIAQIMPFLIREFTKRQTDELYKGKVTLPQFLILDLLNRGGESRMTDLAHATNVTTAAMTGIIDRLIKCGYVLRKYDPRDRRIIRITLTPRGAGLVRNVFKQRRQMIMNIFGSISPAERQDYLRILRHICDNLHQEKQAYPR